MKHMMITCAACVAATLTLPASADPTAPTNPTPAPTAQTTQPISSSLGALVYPAKGQTAAQQSVDEQECYNWAKGQTGFDPAAPAAPPQQASAPAPAPTGPTGARVRGAARGAAAGAV